MTFSTGSSPAEVAIDPAGKYAFAVNADDASISQYSVDPNDGSLAALKTATAAAGTAGINSPSAIAIDPSGMYAFVVDDLADGSNVLQYQANGDSGLGLVAPTPTLAGQFGQSVVILPEYQ